VVNGSQLYERALTAAGGSSLVVELVSNDGYMLQYLVRKGIPVLGREPAANVAKIAERKGVPTLVKFFGRQTARQTVAVAQLQREWGTLFIVPIPQASIIS
jgi:hypothetical protein